MPSQNTDLTPRPLNSSLAWTDAIYTLQEALERYDQTPALYIVGGAVRDAYMRRPIKDIDIATDGGGRRLAKWLAGHFNGAYYALDQERDVGRALISIGDEEFSLDVAALRGGLADDLFDRDFTINAMAVDLRGDLNLVIDPTGGADDLRKRVLRRCSPSSLASDPVRVLRALRQSVQFAYRIERETLADMRTYSSQMSLTSIERVRDQWFRIFALPGVTQALRVADTLGLLTQSFPELLAVKQGTGFVPHFEVIDRLVELFVTISPKRSDATAAQFSLGIFVVAMDRYRARLQQHLGVTYGDGRAHTAVMVLALLLHTLPQADVVTLCERLRLSNTEISLLTHVTGGWSHTRQVGSDPLSIYRFWKRFGTAGIDVILMGLARTLGEQSVFLNQDQWLAEVEQCRVLLSAYFDEPLRLVNPPVLVNGNDLMRALGIEGGPQLGELLEAIREGQVSGTITTREDALRFAQSALRGNDRAES